MKAPQTARAMSRRASRARLAEQVCPKHATKVGRSALAYRCGCPATRRGVAGSDSH